MTDTDLERLVEQHLGQHLDTVMVPSADLDAVERRGRALRSRRRVAGVGAAAAAALVVGTAVAVSPWSTSPGGAGGTDRQPEISVGQLDLSQGLRAHGSPDGRLSLGGRLVEAEQAEYLDTDAAATSYGVVFFDRGRPQLLGADGTVEPLVEGLPAAPGGFHPTAKADAREPWVAWVVLDEEGARLQVYDLEQREVVASDAIGCGTDDCSDVVVDGLDSGTVFVRNAEGTWMWSVEGRRYGKIAGPKTRVADVRNRVVLYDGPPITLPLSAWRFIPGPIDGELSFDGEHLLYWSPRLEPTAGGKPVTLDVPDDALFFTFDTDGSVLVATTGDSARFFDCELPSGRCASLGEMEMVGGDPMFMGNDM